MKCKTLQRRMLLNATATLRIEAHLARCAACRQWRADVAAIETLARETFRAGEPSERVLVNIRREARLRAPESRPVRRHANGWRPAFGLAAAALCVLAGGLWMRPAPEAMGGEAQLSAILLMLQDETDSLTNGLPRAASLDSVARALLMLQGLDADYTESELTTLGEAPRATIPLTRSNPSPHAERYG
jgi:predicted anti-sigma-YlaC factor YlaD